MILRYTLYSLDSKYISAELELDIDTRSLSLSTQNLSSIGQKFSTSKRRNEENALKLVSIIYKTIEIKVFRYFADTEDYN
ncbi:unnamed protein product [Rhizophagus irregularis]|nr:unnamed protein product [Rhizophagus irregularis]